MSEENMNISTFNMTLSEYQSYIAKIIYRLQHENRVDVVVKNDERKRPKYVIEFRPPEWFTELSMDIQDCAFDNLQRLMLDNVKDTVTDYNKEVYELH